jgi:hypothetical protein
MSGIASDKNQTTKDYEIKNVPTEEIEKRHFVNKNLKGEDTNFVAINQNEDVTILYFYSIALFEKN